MLLEEEASVRNRVVLQHTAQQDYCYTGVITTCAPEHIYHQ